MPHSQIYGADMNISSKTSLAAAVAIVATLGLIMPAISADKEERRFELQDFSKVSVNAGINVQIEAGQDFSIYATSATGHLDKLVLYVNGRTLSVEWDKDWLGGLFGSNNKQATVHITMPALSGIDSSSGANAHAFGQLRAALMVDASSGSSVDVDGYNGENITLGASSGASIDADGSCTSLTIDTSSGASVGADGLLCKAVKVDASSGSSVDIYASGTVDLSASSAASIDVSGSPEVLNSSTSSGGDIDY